MSNDNSEGSDQPRSSCLRCGEPVLFAGVAAGWTHADPAADRDDHLPYGSGGELYQRFVAAERQARKRQA